MADTIEFTEEAVKEYLDGAIEYWRQRKLKAVSNTETVMASHYIDAYQSVRISIFGELLP